MAFFQSLVLVFLLPGKMSTYSLPLSKQLWSFRLMDLPSMDGFGAGHLPSINLSHRAREWVLDLSKRHGGKVPISQILKANLCSLFIAH